MQGNILLFLKPNTKLVYLEIRSTEFSEALYAYNGNFNGWELIFPPSLCDVNI